MITFIPRPETFTATKFELHRSLTLILEHSTLFILRTWQLCSLSWCWACSWSRAARRRRFSSGETVESGWSRRERADCVIWSICACWAWSCWSSACERSQIVHHQLANDKKCLGPNLPNTDKRFQPAASPCVTSQRPLAVRMVHR